MTTARGYKTTAIDASDLNGSRIACVNCGCSLTGENLPKPTRTVRDNEGELLYSVTSCPKCGGRVDVYND
jgi:hypothetical protein